ncbi:hypothetical protein D3C86_2064850 [compost metagenome]
MAAARFATRDRPSSKESAPAATNAENSPSEWPATILGEKSGDIFARITEWINIAGWVTLVCFSSSSVPSNMIFVISKPRISLAFSNNALAESELW